MLFNAYLHLEKADSWQRPFSTWMQEVRGGGLRLPWVSPAGIPVPSSLCGRKSSHLILQEASMWPKFCLIQLWVPAQWQAIGKRFMNG